MKRLLATSVAMIGLMGIGAGAALAGDAPGFTSQGAMFGQRVARVSIRRSAKKRTAVRRPHTTRRHRKTSRRPRITSWRSWRPATVQRPMQPYNYYWETLNGSGSMM